MIVKTVEVDIEFDDVLDYIKYASEDELSQFKQAINNGYFIDYEQIFYNLYRAYGVHGVDEFAEVFTVQAKKLGYSI